MTTFLLVRHASHDLLGKTLAGRMPGVSLNAAGKAEAARLAERLSTLPIQAIYSSPLARALETAAPLAERLGLSVQREEAFSEVDFGEWTGLSFEELHDTEAWGYFNTFRSGTRIPGGELMLEAQARIVAGLGVLQKRHEGAMVAVVTHGDMVKAAIAYYLGSPLDLMKQMEISPASVSVLALHSWGAQLLRLNDVGGLQICPGTF